MHRRTLIGAVVASAVVLSVASPAPAADVDAWARRHLAPGTPLAEVRRSLGTHADEVTTERIVIDRRRPLLGRSGAVVAMVVFDHAARHERMVLFKERGAGLVVDAVVHDARVSYGYRTVFYDAMYARQFKEIETRLAVSLGQSYERYVTEAAIAVKTIKDPWGDPDGVFELQAGQGRFLLKPFGGSIEDYSPLRVFVAQGGAALGYVVTVGNGLSRAYGHRWRKEADGRFVHAERLTPAPLGP